MNRPPLVLYHADCATARAERGKAENLGLRVVRTREIDAAEIARLHGKQPDEGDDQLRARLLAAGAAIESVRR